MQDTVFEGKPILKMPTGDILYKWGSMDRKKSYQTCVSELWSMLTSYSDQQLELFWVHPKYYTPNMMVAIWSDLHYWSGWLGIIEQYMIILYNNALENCTWGVVSMKNLNEIIIALPMDVCKNFIVHDLVQPSQQW